MASKYRGMQDFFAKADRVAKQADLAPIGAALLNVPIPFANLGFVHPAFVQTNNFSQAVKDMRENIEQVYTYLKFYCKHKNSSWCVDELKSFVIDLKELDLD